MNARAFNYGSGQGNSMAFAVNGRTYYFSYQTLVALSDPKHGLIVSENVWSVTTGKHLNWIDTGDKKERLSHNKFVEVVDAIHDYEPDLRIERLIEEGVNNK